jgi:transcriptional regulator with XRE-family HTH domain
MLRKARKDKKITQEQLAISLSVTDGYISRLENHPHDCNPTVKLILGLSKELDIEDTDLYKYFVNVINANLENKNNEKDQDI